VLSNHLPVLDENMAPCLELARALGAGRISDIPAKPGGMEPNTIAIAGKEIFVFDRAQEFRPARGARRIAETGGCVCGFERSIGRGRASLLGFKLDYMFTDLHRAVLGSLLGRRLDSPCPVLTRTGRGTTLKTVLNPDDEPHTVAVNGRQLRLPGKTAAWVLTNKRKKTVFI